MIAWPIVLAMVVAGIVGGVCAGLAAATEEGTPADPKFTRWCDRIGRLAFAVLFVLAAATIRHI